jgi:hypothetical protein
MAKASVLDPKAKAAKKKKQAIILAVLFLALMAFQAPRTLKMMKGTPPPATAAPAPATPAPATPGAAPATPAATPTTGTAQTASATVGGDALVVTADLQPAPLEGQLPDLTSFTAKDPFQQQATGAATAGGDTTTPAGGEGQTSGGDKGAAGGDTGTGTDTGGTTGGNEGVTPTSPKAPAGPAPQSAVLSVNGVQEAVNVKSDFPAANPLFHLVSLTAKTAKISIAGGSLSSGAHAITIELGKSTTLMNTADGTRYVITLISTSASASAQPATAAATPPASEPATP